MLVLLMGGGGLAVATESGAAPEPDPTTVAIATPLHRQGPLVVDGRRLDVRALRQVTSRAAIARCGREAERLVARARDRGGARACGGAQSRPATYHHPWWRGTRRTRGPPSVRRSTCSRATACCGWWCISERRGAAETISGDVRSIRVRWTRRRRAAAAGAADLSAFLDGLAPQSEAYHGPGRWRSTGRSRGPAAGPPCREGTDGATGRERSAIPDVRAVSRRPASTPTVTPASRRLR